MKDDTISRQAAINAVRAGVFSAATLYGRSEKGETARKEIERLINALPSVSTEKTGRWVKLSVGYGCSECSLCTNIHGIRDFKYCPNCGAKMGVEE